MSIKNNILTTENLTKSLQSSGKHVQEAANYFVSNPEAQQFVKDVVTSAVIQSVKSHNTPSSPVVSTPTIILPQSDIVDKKNTDTNKKQTSNVVINNRPYPKRILLKITTGLFVSVLGFIGYQYKDSIASTLNNLTVNELYKFLRSIVMLIKNWFVENENTYKQKYKNMADWWGNMFKKTPKQNNNNNNNISFFNDDV